MPLTRKQISVLLGAALISLCIPYFHLKGYFYTCISAFDLAIHQQAIFGYSKGIVNPWIPIQNIHILNDHFDPVNWLGLPFSILFNHHLAGLIAFQYSWYALLLLAVYHYGKKRDAASMLIVMTMAVFNRSLLGGLVFPLHPMTWSMFPVFMLVAGLYQRRDWHAVVWGIFLCFFKETYPLMVLSFSFYFAWQKRWRPFFLLGSFSLIYSIFIFVFREKVFGPGFPYAHKFLAPYTQGVFSGLLNLIRNLDYKEYFNFLYLIFPWFNGHPFKSTTYMIRSAS